MSGQGWCVREGVIILITKNAGLLSNYLYVIIDRQLIIQDARFVIAIYYYLRSYPHGFPLSQYLKPAVEKTAFILDLLEGVYHDIFRYIVILSSTVRNNGYADRPCLL